MLLETDATRLPRLMQCTGSRNMAAVLPPDIDATDRDEGNAAHAMAVAAFNGTPLEDMINKRAYNTFVMTAEMADHVRSYLSALDCGAMEVTTSWGNDQFQINGRADHISWRCHPNDQYQTPVYVTVDDFKYGYRLVEPDENWTLISHAIGYCLANKINPELVTFRIHQPRAYHSDGPLREWTISRDQFWLFYHQIVATLSAPDDTLRTGPFCYGCHALATCPAARAASMNAIDAASVPFSDALTAEQLSVELDLLRHAENVIKGRREAIEELMRHRIKGGEPFPNYALEQQYAHTRFKKGVDAAALRMMFGVDATTKPGLCTPAELKRRGVLEDLMKPFTERPVTGTKLVRVSADKQAQKLLGKR